jgi:hypothetical protein
MSSVFRAPLIRLGALSLLGFLVSGVLWRLDSRTWLNESVWIKPMKFYLSVGIYLSTMHFLLSLLRPRWGRVDSMVRLLGWSMAIITLQSARGVGSHFNQSTPMDLALYGVMGIFAVAQIPVGIVLFRAFGKFAPPELDERLLLGIRWGLGIFILGCVEGAYLSAQSGHTVGAEPGGPGLPFLGWSTVVGDLRIAHFIGMHALQIFPLLGWWVGHSQRSRVWVLVPAMTYVALTLVAWALAIQGKSPFL